MTNVKIVSWKYNITKSKELFNTYKNLLHHDLNIIFQIKDANELDTIHKSIIKYYSDL